MPNWNVLDSVTSTIFASIITWRSTDAWNSLRNDSMSRSLSGIAVTVISPDIGLMTRVDPSSKRHVRRARAERAARGLESTRRDLVRRRRAVLRLPGSQHAR